ncbi:MAG: hypothetical protein KGH60_00840 [Candidatus Micrarchaeota archaeon]|nr:hypothetical protein [Candidatus Micrarchaeota archaeon]
MAIQKKVDTWKLKKWYSVYAPKAFNNALVGEMPANEDKVAINRNIVVSLDHLTKNPNHAYTNVVLKVTDVEGTAAHTKIVSIQQLYSYIRSLVRRYRSIVASVQPVTTSNGTKMVIKLLAITKGRTAHSKILGIRSEMNQLTSEFFKANDSDAAINAIIEGRFQAEIAGKLSHIAPLNKLEVRKLEVEQ